MSEILSGIDYAKLAEKLSERLDSHSTFQWEHFLEQGVDAHFLCRVVGLDGTESLAKASDYWKQTNYSGNYDFEGTYTRPKDKRIVAIYSRRAFVYPQLFAHVKLPSLSLIGNETEINYYLGFEHGAHVHNGIASFYLYTSATYTNSLRAFAGPLNGGAIMVIDVAKPVDFNTAYHPYRVVVTRNLVLFFVVDRLRAVAVQCHQGGGVLVKNNVLPYAVALIAPMPSSLTAFIELGAYSRTAIAPSDFAVPLSPYRFRVSDGKEIIPLRLPLYCENSDTALAGYSISSGSITSHPIPTFGYSNKTVYFMSNQSGSLSIEILTWSGNWRTYDSISISANTLLNYSIDDEVVLARIVFTPSAYPATISEAEVSMS
jgi:hypothetical protein